MKHIQKNFENVGYVDLSEEEIVFLNQFLMEQVNNGSVECVYLVPIYKNERQIKSSIRVVVVEFKGIVCLDENIKKSIYDVNHNMSTKRSHPSNEIDFQISEINEYIGVDTNSLLKWYNDKDLVSSYILFDRHKRFERIQDELKDDIEPWRPLACITNIDKLATSCQKEKPVALNKKRPTKK